ncbi:MAG: hypothetical protein ACYCZX_16840 [Rhodospirillaceae bacterium]
MAPAPPTSPEPAPRPLWPAVIVLAAAAVFYAGFGIYAVVQGRTWSDEVTYVAKSWWYVKGLVAPYSDADATWYMPLYFYQLGLTQMAFGYGLTVGRAASLVTGGLSAVVLFACCRKLTGNPTVAAMAVLLYLANPTTAYYFATAAPLSSVALLFMAAVWLLLVGRERPSAGVSLLLGLVFALLYFYRQNMVLAVAVLAPAYVAVIGRRRLLHAGLLAAGGAAVSAAILAAFPAKLADYAVRLPGLTPILRKTGLLPASFDLILATTVTPLSLAFEPGRISWQDPFNAFLLPYLGTVAAAAGLLFMGRRRDPVWLLFPTLFLFLAATHYLGSVGYCATCILTYTNYFVGVGALAGGLTFAALWQRFEHAGRQPLDGVLRICSLAVLLNVFAPAAVISSAPAMIEGLKAFPAPMLRQTRPIRESTEMESFARIVDETLPRDKPVLVLHNLPSITYAVASSGRILPPQTLNLWQSYREVRANLAPPDHVAALRALEAESLWSDDTLARWIASGYDAVVYQETQGPPRPVLEAELNRYFDLVKRADYRGWKIRFYVRREVGADTHDPDKARAMVCELEFVRRGFGFGC